MVPKYDMSFGKMMLLVFVPSSPVHSKAMHQIEHALTKNSFAGMGVSFLSSVMAKMHVLAIPVSAPSSWRDTLISLISDTGIVVGLLIGCLTLVLKAKEFYKEFIHAAKKRRDPTGTPVEQAPTTNNDSQGLV